MSKFTKKLDQARQIFFSGGRNAGKKMKHNGSGKLAIEDDYTDAIQYAYQPLSSSPLLMQTYQQQMVNIIAQQNALSGIKLSSISSISNIYSNNYISNNSIAYGNWRNGSQGIFSSTFSNNIAACNNPNCKICGNGSTFNNAANFNVLPTPKPNLPRDLNYNNDFGWRCWSWCQLEKKLYSPIQNILWPQAENHAHKYDTSDMVRGVAGIHARFVPENWEGLECPDGMDAMISSLPPSYLAGLYGPNWKHRIEITGLVERFGKFVEGTEGWRSEWAIIRKLYAPTNEIGLDLEKAFPEVEVIYAPKIEYNYDPKFIDFYLAKDGDKTANLAFYPCAKCNATGYFQGKCYTCNGAGGIYKHI